MDFLVDVILFALSLCADCFAVAICSSLTLRKVTVASVSGTAFAFAVIQTALLLAGYFLGDLVVGYIEKISHLIGFLLLLYIGGSMAYKGIRGHTEHADLNGWKNVILGGVATSLDALAAGVSLSMDTESSAVILWQGLAVFLFTALLVALGIVFGKRLGEKVGRGAQIAGGFVLIGIGVWILLGL